MQVRPMELIRTITFLGLGAILMFLVQPMLYQNQLLFFYISDQPVDTWISNEYTPGATLVFCVASGMALFWYFWSARAKVAMAEQIQGWRLTWWLLGVVPVVSIGAAIGLWNTSPDGLASLTFCFVVDVLILYWLSTATSSPTPVKYVPPLSAILRPLIEPGM
jgi:hypothetical protein